MSKIIPNGANDLFLNTFFDYLYTFYTNDEMLK